MGKLKEGLDELIEELAFNPDNTLNKLKKEDIVDFIQFIDESLDSEEKFIEFIEKDLNHTTERDRRYVVFIVGFVCGHNWVKDHWALW